MNLKEMAASEAVKYVDDDMVVGLGSGTTASIAIKLIGKKVKDGMRIVGIPTSKDSETLAKSVGIPIGDLRARPAVDITIDGADEVDPSLNLIKGLGGALVREKIVAYSSNLEVIVADDSKIVQRLGQKAPVPVEVVKFGYEATVDKLQRLGCTVQMRTKWDELFTTDNGNFIADCRFPAIDDPRKLESEINNVPGVVDNGLFVGLADKVIVASKGGIEILESNSVLRARTTSRAP
ncbi:MAG: ribose-5-phosphate isomerase RpiA [Thermoplasmata archaeon]|jgi:ribose 5-phosphate isomerase A|nr:ribose-5-phosphate isomerase RpiA [Thermoplasmata archaeon]